MKWFFTEYVREIASSDEPPDRESFARIWEELRRLLERELRRRGLWGASPSYLGIYGRTRWREADEATSGSGPGREDGLEELVTELYSYVFIDRLNKLVDYLRNKPTIDGLVVMNVRHFLYERQKKHDPLGYRIFQIFHQAVARAVAAKDLFILKGDARIRNDTVLGCRPGLDPDHLPPAPEEKVGEWNDVLMPDLITGKGKARKWVVATLQVFLGRLPGEGTEVFVFRELLAPLKKDARVRWAVRLELSQEETGVEGDAGEDGRPNVVPLVRPDSGVEDRESLEKLNECLAASFDRLTPDRTQDDLKILWQTLLRRAQDGEIPSQRKLAEELSFHRKRLSKLFTKLVELIDDCRTSFAQVAVKTEIGPCGAEGEAMTSNSRAEALREQTFQARRRHAAAEAELRQRSHQGPRPGDVFAVAGTGDLPVEWVLLQEEAGVFHAVPADISPLAGPGDVLVPKEAACGPLTLRCAFGLRLHAADLDPAMRTGSLPSGILEQARTALSLPPGSPQDDATSSVREPAEDPELDEWILEVVEPARQAVLPREGRSEATFLEEDRPDRRLRHSYRRQRVSNPFALAASILLVVSLGLTSGMIWQHLEIVRMKGESAAGDVRAAGNIPFQRLVFSPDNERGDLEEVVLPAGAQELFLFLNVAEFMEEQYRLRLLDKTTKDEIWRSEPLTEMKGTSLTVKLLVRLLPQGDYLCQLYGIAEGQDKPLAQNTLRIIEHEP